MSGAVREAVVLLHGLWMSRHVMYPLQSALDAAGFQVVALDYRSMRGSLAEHHERIDEAVAGLTAPRVHLLGHSMGGVIALSYLMHRSSASLGARLGRVLLLGSPVLRCAAANDFGSHAVGRLLMGSSVALWQAALPLSVPPGSEVAAIAGTESFGLGPLFVTLDGPNDGVVRVEETQLPGLCAHLRLPVSHTGMLFSAEVARQCAGFLQHGRFAP
jgi:pimeloyl-ACP methyl ester carboxylesterase